MVLTVQDLVSKVNCKKKILDTVINLNAIVNKNVHNNQPCGCGDKKQKINEQFT